MIFVGTIVALDTKVLRFYTLLTQTTAVQILLLPFNCGVLAFKWTG